MITAAAAKQAFLRLFVRECIDPNFNPSDMTGSTYCESHGVAFIALVRLDITHQSIYLSTNRATMPDTAGVLSLFFCFYHSSLCVIKKLFRQ